MSNNMTEESDEFSNAPALPPATKELHDGESTAPLGLEEKLGYQFKQKEFLYRALTHSSAYKKTGEDDYERLEFLGDAVLDLAISHLLLESHPTAKEGDLSKLRAALVNTGSLAEIARELEIGSFVRLSRSELANRGAERTALLADVFEAIFGAVYRDAGFGACLELAQKLFGARVESVNPRDPKTELQELLHSLNSEAPCYELERVEGPEHAPQFLTSVTVGGVIMGKGQGTSKKASQQAAAAEAIAKLAPRAAALARRKI